jgi:hypothetical protein
MFSVLLYMFQILFLIKTIYYNHILQTYITVLSLYSINEDSMWTVNYKYVWVVKREMYENRKSQMKKP